MIALTQLPYSYEIVATKVLAILVFSKFFSKTYSKTYRVTDFDFYEKFCCRFAADAATPNC